MFAVSILALSSFVPADEPPPPIADGVGSTHPASTDAPAKRGPGNGSRATTPTRASDVLGLVVETDDDAEGYRLVDTLVDAASEGEAAVLSRGTRRHCEDARLALLERRHGKGNLNLPVRTFGGKQIWSDVAVLRGWRVQENVLTGHHRLLDHRETRRAWGSYEACRTALEAARIREDLRPRSRHLVVLVHGLFRARGSVDAMAEALQEAGYDVETVGYASTQRPLADHAASVGRALESVGEYESISFVAHSLGGLVVRQLLGTDAAWKKRQRVARFVMIGVPNRGSVLAQALRDWRPYRWITGAVGQELTPELAAKVPVPDCEMGIIAGGTGTPRGLNPLHSGDNDGTVLVESTKLDAAKDFVVIPALHSFLLGDEDVIAETKRFLADGSFRAAKSDAAHTESAAAPASP